MIIFRNSARYLQIRLVKQSAQPKIMQMDFSILQINKQLIFAQFV